LVMCRSCATSGYMTHHTETSGECGAFRDISTMQAERGVPRRQFWLRFAARAVLCAQRLYGSWRMLLGLEGGRDLGADGDGDAQVLQSALTSAFVRQGLPPPSAAETGHLLLALGRNAIVLHGGDVEAPMAVAWGVYLATAMLNHSCDPNAAWEFDLDSGKVEVEALRRVGPGEEVEVAYINFPGGRTASLGGRRAALLDFGFTCECRHCAAEAEGNTQPDPKVAAPSGLLAPKRQRRK
jgi:hypothetical protein